MSPLERRSRNTAFALVGVIVGMLALSAASVPLYDLFCRVTGYGGTPGRAANAGAPGPGEKVTVQFLASVDPHLPWRFSPAAGSATVPVGEQQLAFYSAENRSDGPVVGRAVFNVTPHKIGGYFNKIACFCFEEQVLEAGQRVEMPVSFFVDPAMLDDPSTREVRQIVLSYTFYLDEDATEALREERKTSAALSEPGKARFPRGT